MTTEKSPVPCGEDGFRFGKHILRVANLFRRYGDENLSRHEINTGQLHVLGYLLREEKNGAVYQRDLEKALGVRRSSVTSILQNMEKSGLVRRESDSRDGRSKRVCLTERARELNAALHTFIDSLEEELMEGITGEEKAVLCSALLKMIDNLENKERKKV